MKTALQVRNEKQNANVNIAEQEKKRKKKKKDDRSSEKNETFTFDFDERKENSKTNIAEDQAEEINSSKENVGSTNVHAGDEDETFIKGNDESCVDQFEDFSKVEMVESRKYI